MLGHLGQDLRYYPILSPDFVYIDDLLLIYMPIILSFLLNLAPSSYVDIGIIYGSTGSKAEVQFSSQKLFIMSLLRHLDISPKAAQIGFIPLSQQPVANLPFSGNVGSATINSLVNQAKNGFDLVKTLETMKDYLLNEKSNKSLGARKFARKVIILFLDKESSSSLPSLVNGINDLANAGIKVIVVTTGNSYDEIEVSIVPGNDKFHAQDEDDLITFVDDVYHAIFRGQYCL